MSKADLHELQLLKEEEKLLTSIAGKLGDQLNRLKVEELALMSLVNEGNTTREDQDEVQAKPEQSQMVSTHDTEDNQLLNQQPLALGQPQHQQDVEEEEEDEEDAQECFEEQQKQLTALMGGIF